MKLSLVFQAATLANMDSSILNFSINSSSVLADGEDWSGEAEKSSRLDILIIIFTSLILGLMILTTIIGKSLKELQYSRYIISPTCNLGKVSKKKKK